MGRNSRFHCGRWPSPASLAEVHVPFDHSYCAHAERRLRRDALHRLGPLKKSRGTLSSRCSQSMTQMHTRGLLLPHVLAFAPITRGWMPIMSFNSVRRNSDPPVASHAEKSLEFIVSRGLLQAPNNAAVVPGLVGSPGVGDMPLEEVQISFAPPAVLVNQRSHCLLLTAFRRAAFSAHHSQEYPFTLVCIVAP